jgi:hypothetical protein
VSRKEKRELLQQVSLIFELHKIIKHYFPSLIPLLSQTRDMRDERRITYTNKIILFTRILGTVFRIGSMRKLTEEFNTECSISNVGEFLEEEFLEELPHWSSINNYLEGLDPSELESVLPKLLNRLIRMHSFDKSRIRGKYWQILVDGVYLYTFKERHCDHCLSRTHKATDTHPAWTEYYHYALEAKLVLHGNIVCSIVTEFIENAGVEVTKQDCELNAFYRLSEKLKGYFPRLPICLTMDSLYACSPVFEICRENSWHYLVRFKEGRIPSVAQEFNILKTLEPIQVIERTRENIRQTYRYVTGIDYQTHLLNMVEYERSDFSYPFIFLTDLPVNSRNCEQLIEDGRCRWKIENEGFNEQKNHGFALTHLFSYNENAMKNHYRLIQIGHMLSQFVEKALHLWELIRAPSYMIAKQLKQSFQFELISAADTAEFIKKRKYRFP